MVVVDLVSSCVHYIYHDKYINIHCIEILKKNSNHVKHNVDVILIICVKSVWKVQSKHLLRKRTHKRKNSFARRGKHIG